MKNFTSLVLIGAALLTGCAHEFNKRYEEINTGKGFDKACIVETIHAMEDASDVKLLTNGVTLVHQSFPTLVMFERDVPVSQRLEVMGASASAKEQLNFVTADFADKISKYCDVAVKKTGGSSKSTMHSAKTSVVNWPWYEPWKVSHSQE